MSSYVAVGSEFLVNNVTLYTQGSPDFAGLAGGGFVAVWESNDAQQDTSSGGIKGRVIGANGAPIGPEFLINTATANSQTYPSAAGLAGGGFVVTWTTRDPLQDGNYDAIKAQRFDALGAKVGAEFLVNTHSANIQWISSAAGLDTGGFVIAWETYDGAQDGSGRAIKAQVYDESGAKSGGEFLVNTITAGEQTGAEISALSGGRFIVTWHTHISGKAEVRAQIFDASGAKQGGEIFVNTHTFESQVETSVAKLANGGFVITWTTFDPAQDGSGWAVKAQLFDAAGAKVGGEFLVNGAVASSQKLPTVAGLANGDFVVAWRTDDQTADDASGAIKAQVFSATGARIGGEFKANTAAGTLEGDPTVVDLGNGAFAIGWTASASPTWDQNIRAQIFSSGSAPVIRSDGGGDSAAITVAEQTLAVTTVQAFDLDGPSVTYSIAGGADAALFAIDAATGALRFLSAPAFGAPQDTNGDNVYDVVVRASDGTRSDQQALAVSVADANEVPVIVSNGGGDSATLTVAEGTTHVTVVAAQDGDGDPLTYAIAGGADAARFTIDAATGALAFVSAPDREAPADADRNNVYQVIVRASDGSFSDTQSLSIGVANVNEAPTVTFYGSPTSGPIVTSLSEGSSSFQGFGAADPDGGPLAWSLSGTDASLFTFDAAGGALRFNALPDYEAPGSSAGTNSYRVTLTVSDGSLGHSVAVTIHIRDVNEKPAILTDGGGDTASLSVDEGNTAVTTVFARDPEGAGIIYSITAGADASAFDIDPATGALTFSVPADYEAPADADGDNVYHVVVAASDGRFFDTQAIAVTVADRNEAPVIGSNGGGGAASVSLFEGESIVTTVAAVDPEGSALTYSLGGGADAARFTIDPETGVLSFIEAPDFEAPADAGGSNRYTVEVEASDGAASSRQTVEVVVGNVNEGAVLRSSSSPQASENQTDVTTVVAEDADGDPVTYAVSGGADAALFAIDAETGALSFLAAPDFEAPGDVDGDNIYEVEISASDGALSTPFAMFVELGDRNEPVAFVTGGDTGEAALALSENQGNVIVLKAMDVDSVTTFGIAGGADADLFEIDPTTDTLRFKLRPDFEAPRDADGDNVYEVLVSASDSEFYDYLSLSIAVSNVYEGISFTGSAPAFAADENATAPVGRVAATGEPGLAINYSIAGGADAHLFAIDAVTGAIGFAAAPDHEAPADADADNVYELLVEARDGVSSAAQWVSVRVSDVDEAVRIVSYAGAARVELAIDENGSAAATVEAADPDGHAVAYGIVGGADAALFTIDAATGALRFAAAPDREAPADGDRDNIYEVQVAASTATSSAVQAFAVTVLNRNEGIAIASNGGGASASISVAENSRAVTTVAASDPDGTPSTFSILGGADAHLFEIDAATGALGFAAAPDHETPADLNGDNVYELIVAAGDGEFTATQVLSLRVGNVDEAVRITSYGAAASVRLDIAENEIAAALVQGADPDGGTLTYSLAGGADAHLFAIDPATGALAWLSAPNFEAPADADADNVYDVVVSVSDGRFADAQAFALRVTGVNEAIAIVSNGGAASASLSVNENNRTVATFAASDPDGTPAAWSIVGGADAARFTIDAASGLLQFAAAPDHEAPGDANGDNVYSLVVQASDGLFTDVQALTVTVQNQRDGVSITGTTGGDTISGTAALSLRTTAAEDIVFGRDGHDTIYGLGGDDTLYGDGGNDTLVGGAGADRLVGGPGKDTFVYNAPSESGVSAQDSIADFSRAQGDRINLGAIDANANAALNQSFAFIGTGAFTKSAGQLRYEQSGGNTFVSGDVNGDGAADFTIRLDGLVPIAASDFIL